MIWERKVVRNCPHLRLDQCVLLSHNSHSTTVNTLGSRIFRILRMSLSLSLWPGVVSPQEPREERINLTQTCSQFQLSRPAKIVIVTRRQREEGCLNKPWIRTVWTNLIWSKQLEQVWRRSYLLQFLLLPPPLHLKNGIEIRFLGAH